MEVLIQAVKPIILSLVNTAQSDETRQRRTNELRAINEVGQAINSGLGLDETLELIADRATEALHGKAATRYRHARLPERAELVTHKAPAWQFLFLPRHPLSATDLRNSLGADAFSMA